tara:strand:- start:3811 stop:3996 length:186 start_codon:yes stop_codon:yes gene_type:complete
MATRFWVESNESSRARYFRADWASKNEGEWKRHGNLGWQWFPAEVKQVVKKPKKSILRRNK